MIPFPTLYWLIRLRMTHFSCSVTYPWTVFPLQFGDQILIFDDVVLVVATDMDSVYVFIRNGNGIADKENGL